MIEAGEPVRIARGLIGTPYDQMDCINLIKAVIRRSAGGVPGYTTAGTATLWASGGLPAGSRYRDLVERRLSILNVEAGWLAFKGKPVGAGGQPHHVGLVTGDGTVIHSSSARGRVVETKLSGREGWTLAARHRYIRTGAKGGNGKMAYRARVITGRGGLNLRAGPGEDDRRIGVIAKGEVVDVLEEHSDEWAFVRSGKKTGYVSRAYLEKLDAAGTEAPGTEQKHAMQWYVHVPCANETDAYALMHLIPGAIAVLGGDD